RSEGKAPPAAQAAPPCRAPSTGSRFEEVLAVLQQAVKVGSIQSPARGRRRALASRIPSPPSHRARRDDRLVIASLLAADLVVLAIACVLAIVIRDRFSFLGVSQDVPDSLVASSVVIAGVWMIAMLVFGAGNPRVIGSGAEIYRAVLLGTVATVGFVGAVLFLADIPLSRPYFVVLFVVGPLLLLLVRALARRVVNLARARGRLRAQVLVVGSTGHVRGIVRTLSREVWLGYDVVGAVAPISEERSDASAGVPILGDEPQLLDLVREVQPDVVLFTAGASASAEEVRRVARELEGVDVRGIVRTLAREVWLGYDVVGAVAPSSEERSDASAGVPILGDEPQLLDLVREVQPDVVLFTAGSSASAEEFRRVAWELEELEVGVIVVPGVSEISGDRIRMRPVAGPPLVHMDLPRSRKALKKGKRIFDVAASSAL